jgi:hypothetical protein
MRNLFLIFVLTGLLLTACTPRSEGTPSDFSVALHWNTGSLPPEYIYSYTVTLEPDLTGALEVWIGIRQEDDANHYVTDFSLSLEQLDDLYQSLQEEDAFRKNWNTGETSEGGPGTSLELSAQGKTYLIPGLSELSGEDYAAADRAMDLIRAVVPAELWQEMMDRQLDYLMNYEE